MPSAPKIIHLVIVRLRDLLKPPVANLTRSEREGLPAWDERLAASHRDQFKTQHTPFVARKLRKMGKIDGETPYGMRPQLPICGVPTPLRSRDQTIPSKDFNAVLSNPSFTSTSTHSTDEVVKRLKEVITTTAITESSPNVEASVPDDITSNPTEQEIGAVVEDKGQHADESTSPEIILEESGLDVLNARSSADDATHFEDVTSDDVITQSTEQEENIRADGSTLSSSVIMSDSATESIAGAQDNFLRSSPPASIDPPSSEVMNPTNSLIAKETSLTVAPRPKSSVCSVSASTDEREAPSSSSFSSDGKSTITTIVPVTTTTPATTDNRVDEPSQTSTRSFSGPVPDISTANKRPDAPTLARPGRSLLLSAFAGLDTSSAAPVPRGPSVAKAAVKGTAPPAPASARLHGNSIQTPSPPPSAPRSERIRSSGTRVDDVLRAIEIQMQAAPQGHPFAQLAVQLASSQSPPPSAFRSTNTQPVVANAATPPMRLTEQQNPASEQLRQGLAPAPMPSASPANPDRAQEIEDENANPNPEQTKRKHIRGGAGRNAAYRKARDERRAAAGKIGDADSSGGDATQ
ncbi:hypothetical protein QFC24_005692 [Naganishia onofrii]|uniref:Uncharacterized protein n=1 Tax=Naganishia onofrii TaxID=1851511 RepID=A0ACC2X7Y0_9TREE|nr:hypothetical protein QFC24_005692 [Naganishia onofrii]